MRLPLPAVSCNNSEIFSSSLRSVASVRMEFHPFFTASAKVNISSDIFNFASVIFASSFVNQSHLINITLIVQKGCQFGRNIFTGMPFEGGVIHLC